MKKVNIFILAICIFCTNCTKESIFDQKGYFGQGTALLNNNPYSGNVGVFFNTYQCFPDTCITLKIVYSNQFGEKRKDITIGKMPLKTGKFQINYSPFSPFVYGYYTMTYSELSDEGDVLTGLYRPYQLDTANWINIRKLDVKTGDIEGEFQASVLRSPGLTPSGEIQETVKIKEGKFFGKINWYK